MFMSRFVGTTTFALANAPVTISPNTWYKLRATLVGSDFTLELIRVSDSVLIASISGSDSTYSSGFYGVSYRGDSELRYDNFSMTEIASNSISISTQSYRIWARSNSDDADVTIEGSYSGSPATIERRVDDGAWVAAISNPAGGAFSDTFTLATGQYSVSYRFSDDTATEATVTPIAVGEVIACTGQSNIVGWKGDNQVFSDSSSGVTAYLFGNDDNFKQLQDPYSSSENQVDLVNDNDASPAGSWIVRFANQWLQNSDVPIGFIPCAKGGTTIQMWQKDDTTRIRDGINLYDSLTRRIGVVGGVNRVFFQLGEQDSSDAVLTEKSVYKSKLLSFANNVLTDFGVKTFIVPLHTMTRADFATQTATTGQGAIREAQVELASENNFIDVGPLLTDIDLSGVDGLHFETDEQLETVASRVYSGYVGNVSTLNISVSGIPDGTYKTYLIDQSDNILYNANATYASGAVTLSGLAVAVGTALEGYVIDNESPHTNGAVISGVTV